MNRPYPGKLNHRCMLSVCAISAARGSPLLVDFPAVDVGDVHLADGLCALHLDSLFRGALQQRLRRPLARLGEDLLDGRVQSGFGSCHNSLLLLSDAVRGASVTITVSRWGHVEDCRSGRADGHRRPRPSPGKCRFLGGPSVTASRIPQPDNTRPHWQCQGLVAVDLPILSPRCDDCRGPTTALAIEPTSFQPEIPKNLIAMCASRSKRTAYSDLEFRVLPPVEPEPGREASTTQISIFRR